MQGAEKACGEWGKLGGCDQDVEEHLKSQTDEWIETVGFCVCRCVILFIII